MDKFNIMNQSFITFYDNKIIKGFSDACQTQSDTASRMIIGLSKIRYSASLLKKALFYCNFLVSYRGMIRLIFS